MKGRKEGIRVFWVGKNSKILNEKGNKKKNKRKSEVNNKSESIERKNITTQAVVEVTHWSIERKKKRRRTSP